MLKLDLKVGDSIAIGPNVVLTIEEKSGKSTRVAIKADKSVPIKRLERSSAADLAAKYGLATMT